jgi:hypothetical protein
LPVTSYPLYASITKIHNPLSFFDLSHTHPLHNRHSATILAISTFIYILFPISHQAHIYPSYHSNPYFLLILLNPFSFSSISFFLSILASQLNILPILLDIPMAIYPIQLEKISYFYSLISLLIRPSPLSQALAYNFDLIYLTIVFVLLSSISFSQLKVIVFYFIIIDFAISFL